MKSSVLGKAARVLIAVAAVGFPAAPRGAATPAAQFDFYLVALSVHAAFCGDGHGRMPECKAQRSRVLAIHGLWPERLQPGAYPRDCPAPRLDLRPATRAALAEWMPGMASGLHVHEWRTHGSCSGLEDDRYFLDTIALARNAEAALGASLTTARGRRISAQQLRAAADRIRPGFGASFTLHCRTLRAAPPSRRRDPHLIEVRLCVDNDGAQGGPRNLLSCTAVARRDQGCGQSFWIADGP